MTKTFQKGSGCYTCRNCDKRTRETGECESDVQLCLRCFTEAGWDNEHSDGCHERQGFGPDAKTCPICNDMGYDNEYKPGKAPRRHPDNACKPIDGPRRMKKSDTRTFLVHMLSFAEHYQVRKVQVPKALVQESYGKDDTNQVLLQEIYRYGQEDHQPQRCCSVSTGDVIELDEELYVVAYTGFRKLSATETLRLCMLDRKDRGFTDVVFGRKTQNPTWNIADEVKNEMPGM